MQGKLERYAHDDDPLVSRDLEECSVLNVCFHQIYDVVLRQKAIGKSASLLFHSINFALLLFIYWTINALNVKSFNVKCPYEPTTFNTVESYQAYPTHVQQRGSYFFPKVSIRQLKAGQTDGEVN